MDDADMKALKRELKIMRKSRIDHYVMDAMERAINYAVRAKNGLPENERIIALGESQYWQSLGLLRFMYKTQQKLAEAAIVPQGKIERFVYLIRPVAFPFSLVACCIIFSPHFKEVAGLLKSLYLMNR
jgi:hypothetical protein